MPAGFRGLDKNWVFGRRSLFGLVSIACHLRPSWFYEVFLCPWGISHTHDPALWLQMKYVIKRSAFLTAWPLGIERGRTNLHVGSKPKPSLGDTRFSTLHHQATLT